MMSDTNAPPGYTVKSGAPEDISELVALIGAAQLKHAEVAVASESVWRTIIADPEVDPSRDYVQIRSAETGELAGFGRYSNRPPHVESSTQGFVHPDHERLGLGTHIVNWGLERSRNMVDMAPPDARITNVCSANARNLGASQLLEDNSYSVDRYFLEMEREFDGPVTIAELPEGLDLRTMTGPEDVEVMVDPVMEAFRDHYGHTESTRESEVEQWHLWRTVDSWDDSLVWIVEASGVAIAVNACITSHGAKTDTGYVAVLGVVKEWRGKGIARALLTMAFAEFERRGQRAVALHVDADSLTGATRLYESVGMHESERTIDHIREIRQGTDMVVR